MKLLTSIFFGTVSICTLCSGSDAETDRLPDFCWDTVPLYMHVRKGTAFTPEEIKCLASFPLITFEKTTGKQDTGSTEKGTLRAAQAVKALNPRAKILYYRNILVHYGVDNGQNPLWMKSIPEYARYPSGRAGSWCRRGAPQL